MTEREANCARQRRLPHEAGGSGGAVSVRRLPNQAVAKCANHGREPHTCLARPLPCPAKEAARTWARCHAC